MIKNPINALRKVFATKKMIFIAILLTIGAISALSGAISDSPDFTKFTVPIIDYEIDLLEIVGEEMGDVLTAITNLALVMSIIGVLPQLLAALALWFIYSGKADSDAAAKRACLGLNFIKLQSFIKILTMVSYAIAVGIVAVLALTVGSRIDESGNTVGIILGITALLIGYFVLVISYHSKLMTMMITVSNTLRTGVNQVRRFRLVTVLNVFFALYYIISSFSGSAWDIIAGICVGLVYFFLTFLFSNFRDICGWADVEETRKYMKSLASDPSRIETARVLGFEKVQTPNGEAFMPTVKGIVTKQFFGTTLSPIRRSEADGTLLVSDRIAATLVKNADVVVNTPTRVDFSAAERIEPSVLPLFSDGCGERFNALDFSVSENRTVEGVLRLEDATVYRDFVSDKLILRLNFTNLSPVKTVGVRFAFSAEGDAGECLGIAENVLIKSDASTESGAQMLAELGVVLPDKTAKISATIKSLLFADGLSRDNVGLSFDVATKERLERDAANAKVAEEALKQAKIDKIDKLKEEVLLIEKELFSLNDGENPILAALGFVNPYQKPLTRLLEIIGSLEELEAPAKITESARSLYAKYEKASADFTPKKKKRMTASIATLAVIATVVISLIIPNVIVPIIKFNQALKMQKDGKIVESYYALKALDGEEAESERKRALAEIQYLVIPDYVTEIEEYEFQNCTNIKSVTLHSGLTYDTVGYGAFAGCTSIEEFTFNTGDLGMSHLYGVIAIEENQLPALKKVNFCGGERITYSALSNCNAVTEITISDSITAIESFAFSNCRSLTALYVPSGVTTFGYGALEGCTSLMLLSIGATTQGGEDIVSPNGDIVFKLPSINSVENNPLQHVIVTSGTVIASNAFRGLPNLQTVELPSTLERIESGAFSECAALKEIKIPSSVKKIGESAFSWTQLEKAIVDINAWLSVELEGWNETLSSHLYTEVDGEARPVTEIVVPEGITQIEKYAFVGLETLKSVKLSSTVKNIDDYAFRNCTSLETVDFASVENIGKGAFSYCAALTAFCAPSTLRTIGDSAFYGCEYIKELTLNDGLISMGSEVFWGCNRIFELTLPDSLSYCGSICYMNNLFKVTLGKSLESVGEGFLNSCPKLCEIYDRSLTGVGAEYTGSSHYMLKRNYYTDEVGESKIYREAGFILFDNADEYNLLVAYVGSEKSIVLPYSFNGTGYSVWEYAFAYNDTLEEIEFSAGVIDIRYRVIAFSPNVRSLKVASDNATYISRSNCVIRKESKVLILGCKNSTIPTDNSVTCLGFYSFYGCLGLTEITVPYNISETHGTAYADAFAECYNLVRANVNSKYVGQAMFSGCTSLKEVYLGNFVEGIHNVAFSGCTSLEYINIPSSVTKIESGAFAGCDKLFKYDEYGCAYLDKWLVSTDNNSKVEEVTVKNGTIGIAPGAFIYNKASAISLPGGLKYIENEAFKRCENLLELVIPDTVISIGSNAFSECPLLCKINIPSGIKYDSSWFTNTPNVVETVDGVKYIYNWAVGAEADITSAVIREGTVGIAPYAFDSCASLVNVSLPNGIEYIYYYAFRGCSSLAEISIPNTVKELWFGAFGNTAISEILLPSGLLEIDDVFNDGSDAERYIYYQGSRSDYVAKHGGGTISNKNTNLCYYSASTPGDDNLYYWHYVSNKPTLWN